MIIIIIIIITIFIIIVIIIITIIIIIINSSSILISNQLGMDVVCQSSYSTLKSSDIGLKSMVDYMLGLCYRPST